MEDRIIAVFLAELAAKPFSQISISSIMKRAGLPRTEFYLFFDNLDDCITTILAARLRTVFESLTDVFIDDKTLVAGVQFVMSGQDTIEKLWKLRTSHTDVFAQLKEQFTKLAETSIAQKWPTLNGTDLSYFSQYYAVSILNMIEWYFDHDVSARYVSTRVAALYQGLFTTIANFA